MRNYDSWNRYLDNKGNPLHGCVQFMVKDGNTVAPIYNSDGTPLSNPILTDIYGRTQYQVFVDVDVVAYFYSYIGNGIWNTQLDIDTSDQSKWYLQYTIESQDSSNINVEGTSTLCIPNIEALRNLDINGVPEINGVKVITLLGYYNVGDKEPINYYWDAESTEQDDDGAVIHSDNEINGRWIMVQPTIHCDSRHYGVFPSNSNNMNDQSYGIAKLFNYCNLKGIRPYFNANEDYYWYKYSNINVSADTIDTSKGVKFYDLGDSTIIGEWSNDPLFTQSNTNVVAKNIKTSWNAKSYTGYENVIIDETSTQKNFQDAYIDVRINPCYGYNFNHCTFAENGNLGSNNGMEYNTFVNCRLTSRMFIVSGNNKPFFGTGQAQLCTIDQDDWVGDDALSLYIQLRMTNVPDANFDYRCVTSALNPVVAYTSRVIITDIIRLNNFNYVGSACRIDTCNASILELNNCTGKYDLSNWNGSNKTIIIKNCRDISLTSLPLNSNITIESSTIGIETSNPCNLFIKDVTLVGEDTYILDNFTSYNSIINATIYAKNSVVKDSQINKEFHLIPQDGVTRTVSYRGWFTPQNLVSVEVSKFIHGYFDNNIFNDKIVIDAWYNNGSEGYTVDEVLVDSFTFINNDSGLQDPWEIKPAIGAFAHDSLHSYRWAGNKGTFQCVTQVTCSYVGNEASNYGTPGGLIGNSNGCIGAIAYSEVYQEQYLPDGYFDRCFKYFCDNMKLFTIGSTDVVTDLEFTLQPEGGAQFHLDETSYYGLTNLGTTQRVSTLFPSEDYNPMTTSPTRVEDIRNPMQFVDAADPKFPAYWTVPAPWTPYWQLRNFNLGKIANDGNMSNLNRGGLVLTIRQKDKN